MPLQGSSLPGHLAEYLPYYNTLHSLLVTIWSSFVDVKYISWTAEEATIFHHGFVFYKISEDSASIFKNCCNCCYSNSYSNKLKTSCGELMCGKYLVEVKWLSSKRNSWPAIALIMNGIVVRNFDGCLSINPTHIYYYQMQSQMSITEIRVCHLVA